MGRMSRWGRGMCVRRMWGSGVFGLWGFYRTVEVVKTEPERTVAAEVQGEVSPRHQER